MENLKPFQWDKEKDEKLKQRRGVSFERVVSMLKKKDILAAIDNPNQKRYPGQKIFIIEIDKYCFMVPYVEDNEKLFLKTIIPSRKATKKYIKNKKI